MRTPRFRLRRAPLRLDAPGDNWPVFPLPCGRGTTILEFIRRFRPRRVFRTRT